MRVIIKRRNFNISCDAARENDWRSRLLTPREQDAHASLEKHARQVNKANRRHIKSRGRKEEDFCGG